MMAIAKSETSKNLTVLNKALLFLIKSHIFVFAKIFLFTNTFQKNLKIFLHQYSTKKKTKKRQLQLPRLN